MNGSTQKANSGSKIGEYFRRHKVSLGLLLAAYGAFYLSSVIMSGWSIPDWGTDTTTYPPFAVNSLLPRSFMAPIFFVTGLPALLVGAAMLVTYCVRGFSAATVENRERVAFLLTAFGFGYVVVGAWPLGNKVDFAWEWQKQIVSNGVVFTWLLYVLGIVVLAVGCLSVYRSSKIYHQQHPEFAFEN